MWIVILTGLISFLRARKDCDMKKQTVFDVVGLSMLYIGLGLVCYIGNGLAGMGVGLGILTFALGLLIVFSE